MLGDSLDNALEMKQAVGANDIDSCLVKFRDNKTAPVFQDLRYLRVSSARLLQ